MLPNGFISGFFYKTITIDTQTWMAENLRTTKYSNGDPIIDFTATTGSAPTGGTYSDYDNQEKYVPVYGRLYDVAAVQSTKNLAPTGWGIPSDDDWKTLILYLDPNAVINDPPNICYSPIAAGKLKESGNGHWLFSNTATNESGFAALPGGYRDLAFDYISSYYSGIIGYGFYWSSEGQPVEMRSTVNYVFLRQASTIVSASVRCITTN